MFLNKQLFSLIFQSRRTQLRISSYDPEVLPNLPIKIWGKSIKGLMSYYRTYKQRVLLYICRWLKHCHSILYARDKSLNCFYSILSTGRDGHVPLFFSFCSWTTYFVSFFCNPSKKLISFVSKILLIFHLFQSFSHWTIVQKNVCSVKSFVPLNVSFIFIYLSDPFRLSIVGFSSQWRLFSRKISFFKKTMPISIF